MFKKKNIVSENIDETVEIRKEEKQEPIQNRDNPASFFDLTDPQEKEIVKDESQTLKKRKQKVKKDKKSYKKNTVEVSEDFDDEVIVAVVGEESWIWANTEEFELKKEKEQKKKGRKSKQVEEEEVPQPKKELSTYFEESKESNKKLSKKEQKANIKDKKSKKNKKSKRDELAEDIKNQKVFRYDGKKYSKVEEFITYLNEHYLDIDKISEEVLEDENFFGWVNKNSGVFAKSLKEFQEIKTKIENNS